MSTPKPSYTGYCNQHQSPLLRILPTELLDLIIEFSLTSSDPITDPHFPPSLSRRVFACKPDHASLPSLGVPILRTCRRIHSQVSFKCLYANNTFRFTSPCMLASFFTILPESKRNQIKHVSLDLRPDFPNLCPGHKLADWIDYLSLPVGSQIRKVDLYRGCGHYPLRADLDSLQVLTIDLTEADLIQDEMWRDGAGCPASFWLPGHWEALMEPLKQFWSTSTGLKEVKLRSLSRKGGKEMELRLRSKEELEACAGLEMNSISEDEKAVVVKEEVALSRSTRRIWDELIRELNPPPPRPSVSQLWSNLVSMLTR